eukprot:CAMPEP_0196224308 /NCGR_PEP_ID=MMETSP0912-20130531/48425_1 /TAXON_ID=49265 /ORGANISM="Thalassiosira rotula, Strain GSO102" /LENGTH=114 /DNA_ID=CAMNT_0041503591 /DNA_START=20 /DNA_END=361 /DNA_ORIENTATION=+
MPTTDAFPPPVVNQLSTHDAAWPTSPVADVVGRVPLSVVGAAGVLSPSLLSNIVAFPPSLPSVTCPLSPPDAVGPTAHVAAMPSAVGDVLPSPPPANAVNGSPSDPVAVLSHHY